MWSGTGAWNCHGRTFDARRSWVPYADPWLDCDGPYTISSPAPGQAIIWWGPDGWTSHSVTIAGTWNGTSTLVSSKYGTQGQYRHALYNVIRVYGYDWSVIGFRANPPIYYSLPDSPEVSPAQQQTPGTNARSASQEERNQKLKRDREKMPWHDTLLLSEIFYAAERPRLIAQVSGLREETRGLIQNAATPSEQIDALFSDFGHATHYGFLGIYNSPAHSEEFISSIEAGNILLKMAEKHPARFRADVARRLEETFIQATGEMQDRVRGASLHFLARLLDAKERRAAMARLRAVVPPPTEQTTVPTYTEYYFQKMAKAK
jgi:hypothetical protein